MMVLAEVGAIHTDAKIVIYPCNPRVSLKIFNNEKRGRMRFVGAESNLEISSYDINTFVIDINNCVIFAEGKRVDCKLNHNVPGTTNSRFSGAFCVISKGKSR